MRFSVRGARIALPLLAVLILPGHCCPHFRSYVESEEDCVGSRWTIGGLMKHLQQAGKDVDALRCAIDDIVAKLFFGVRPQIVKEARRRRSLGQLKACYELYGLDIAIDDVMRPFLIEVLLRRA